MTEPIAHKSPHFVIILLCQPFLLVGRVYSVMGYHTSSRDYLKRARSRLADGTQEALFYAALELRCGIEARMSQYLEVWEHISKKKKKGWRIADLGRNLEDAFKVGNKIVRWTVHDQHSGQMIICLYYTPVTDKLKRAGEKLGNHLHSMKKYRNSTDQLWLRLRNELEDIYSQLAVANKGTLLGPPLKKSGTQQVDMILELPPGVDSKVVFEKIINKGEKIRIKVDYLSHLPKNLEEEAHTWQVP